MSITHYNGDINGAISIKAFHKNMVRIWQVVKESMVRILLFFKDGMVIILQVFIESIASMLQVFQMIMAIISVLEAWPDIVINS